MVAHQALLQARTLEWAAISFSKSRQCIKKQRHYFTNKGPYSHGHGLSGRRKWQPTSVFLPRESCGQKSLVGCCPWCRQSQTRLKRLSMHACIREGNGSPLQCSCLENPRDRGPWWAAVCGVEQSRTRLKRLSSSSMVFPAGLSWSFSIRHVRM